MSRMRILTATEEESFEQPPLLDHQQRKKFFSFPKGVMDTAATLRTLGGQIGFLLMCGYFKAAINMLGEYDFSDEKIQDSLGILPLKSAA